MTRGMGILPSFELSDAKGDCSFNCSWLGRRDDVNFYKTAGAIGFFGVFV